MALTVSDLTDAQSRLIEARASGIRVVVDQNGERIEYGSDFEMRNALAFLSAEIAKLNGSAPKRVVTFKTSKGV